MRRCTRFEASRWSLPLTVSLWGSFDSVRRGCAGRRWYVSSLEKLMSNPEVPESGGPDDPTVEWIETGWPTTPEQPQSLHEQPQPHYEALPHHEPPAPQHEDQPPQYEQPHYDQPPQYQQPQPHYEQLAPQYEQQQPHYEQQQPYQQAPQYEQQPHYGQPQSPYQQPQQPYPPYGQMPYPSQPYPQSGPAFPPPQFPPPGYPQPYAAVPPQKNGNSKAKLAGIGVGIVALLGTAVGVGFVAGKDRGASKTVTAAADSTTSADSTVPGSATTVAATSSESTIAGSTNPSGEFSIAKIQPAMVQIRTQGTYREFGKESTSSPGAGSGFILSSDGLAVTNNHVVAGAATIEVFIGGDPTAHPARVLGRSECNDLALIDIDGDGYKSLQWSDRATTPGIDVYAAGFPLGESEPTITKGIVSKAKADGNMAWASIDHIIEHDANIQPGNSGGALVTSDGKVLGVNFAGGDAFGSGTAQFFAIANDLARPVIEKLKTGDFETLGVNGKAFRDEEKKVSGVWVVAVQDGSPAARVGMKPGDIITTMKGFPVGLDGTMRDYCKVLRSSTATEPIGVEVYRPDTEKTLSGEFRGSPLTESFSFAEPQTAGAVVALAPNQVADGDPYTYVRVQDDSGKVSVEVPTAYSEVDGSEFTFEGGTSPAVIATPSLTEFKDADIPTAPGVFVTSVDLTQFGVPAGTKIPAASYEEVLDTLSKTVSSSCTIGDRNDFDRNGVLGRFQTYTDCGPAKTATFVVVAAPPDSSYLLLILFVAKDKEDLFALDRAVSTFQVQ